MLNKHRNKTYKVVTKPTNLEQIHFRPKKKYEKTSSWSVSNPLLTISRRKHGSYLQTKQARLVSPT